MNKSEEIKRFERDLNESAELREKLEAEFKRVATAKDAESDGEAMVKAAAALGYAVTLEDLERAVAELEAVDDDELDSVAGGDDNGVFDEHGHEWWCLGNWHCCLVTRHTETESKRVFCFNDYRCAAFYHHPD
ncbi:MAG: hypothetical protein IKW79_02465 [Schwartzia sp.]|nr:hypothetical protein [Schwartzia sp. (in: firmicutes)]